MLQSITCYVLGPGGILLDKRTQSQCWTFPGPLSDFPPRFRGQEVTCQGFRAPPPLASSGVWPLRGNSRRWEVGREGGWGFILQVPSLLDYHRSPTSLLMTCHLLILLCFISVLIFPTRKFPVEIFKILSFIWPEYFICVKWLNWRNMLVSILLFKNITLLQLMLLHKVILRIRVGAGGVKSWGIETSW